MKKNKKDKLVIYYKDLLNDDFAGTNIKEKKVDGKYKYIHKNLIWRCCSFIFYHIFAFPFLSIYTHFFAGVRFKFENKKAFKKLKSRYFLYGNHTGVIDAYLPSLITFPRKNRIITSPDAVALKGVGSAARMLGAMPVPTTTTAYKNFITAIEYYYNARYPIVIYPEAHIWPYYTDIRPFVDSSFSYPVKLNAPVVAFVTTYKEPTNKLRKTKRTVYISEPFYPDQEKPVKEAKKELRDKVYNWMKETTSKYSTYQYIEYVQVDNDEDVTKDIDIKRL